MADLEAVARLTRASRKKAETWEQPYAAQVGVVVDPKDLCAILTVLSPTPVGEKEDGAPCRDHPTAGRMLDEDDEEVCAECHESRVAEALMEGQGGDETLPAKKWSPLKVIYRNWRGETRERLLYPLGARFGTSEWHPNPTWLLSAIDAETGETREFAMADMDGPASRMEAISTLTAERDAALTHEADHAG